MNARISTTVLATDMAMPNPGAAVRERAITAPARAQHGDIVRSCVRAGNRDVLTCEVAERK